MNLNTLKDFRQHVLKCFTRAGDALFNTMDALSSETTAHSFPELSLSPLFERKWPSQYAAFKDGKIDAKLLREVFVQFAPVPSPGSRVFLGVDTSNLFRPDAETSADRTLVSMPNLPRGKHAASPGWFFSSVVLLPVSPGQGTFVLDTQRVTSSELATGVAGSQVLNVVDLLVQRGLRPVLIGDRWYACAPFLVAIAAMAADCLLRVKSNRVFYRAAPLHEQGKQGRPRKDGARFQCHDGSTHGTPDATWEGTDDHGKRVEVKCWNHLHLRQAREIEVSVIQVIRHGASGKKRDPKVSWFVWKGDEPTPLAEISHIYRKRYSHEHGYRLDKQVLLWDEPRLRTPEQTERWTHIVSCAHNQLVLARPLVTGIYHPWETRRSVLTLAQVRRAMPTFLRELGTPAHPPQPRGKSPGRAKGFHPQPALRFPAICKTSEKQQTSKTSASTSG